MGQDIELAPFPKLETIMQFQEHGNSNFVNKVCIVLLPVCAISSSYHGSESFDCSSSCAQ